MWYIFYCYCIAGHSLGALMYLKTKIINISHLRGFLQLLQKNQVSGLFVGFCISGAICDIKFTTVERCFNLAQILM